MIHAFGRLLVCSEKRLPEIAAEIYQSLTLDEKAEFLVRIGARGSMKIEETKITDGKTETIVSHLPLDWLFTKFCG